MLSKFKEALLFHNDGFKTLKYVHKEDSSVIPIHLISAAIKAAYPYINLFFFSDIIDSLLNKDFKYASTLVVLMVISNLAVGILMDVIEKVAKVKSLRVNSLMETKIRMKALQIDYETLDDSKTLEDINTALISIKYSGGFDEILENYCKILQNIFSIITSVSMVIYLCFMAPHTSIGFLNFTASTAFSFTAVVLCILFTVVINSTLSKYFNNMDYKFFSKRIKAERTLSYYLNQVMRDYEKGKAIRLYNMNSMVSKRYGEGMDLCYNTYNAAYPLMVKEGILNDGLSGFVTLYSYTLVALKVLARAISIGAFTKYVGAIAQMNSAMNEIVTTNSRIKIECKYLKLFNSFLEMKNKRHTGTIPVEKRLDNEFEFEFHNVSFSYPGTDIQVLKNLSCRLDMKGKMAIVGTNGSGKTTFIKLLCRLYDPTEGYITLNGIDIKKYDYDEYLKLFGVVFQDFSMFAFPLKENVCTGTEIDEAKLNHCLELTGIKPRIDKLPMGLSTPLYKYDKGGVEMSGGELQKLAMSRALYKDAPFVILDEPTAALDPLSEYEIYSKFGEMVKNKSSIYISHRMSSCRFCDDIFVFDNGNIVQRGSHQALMEMEDKPYFKLWNAQAKYYNN